jgi:hypothetical protein
VKTIPIIAAALAATLASAADAQGMRPDPFGDATVSHADAQAKASADFAKFDANHDGFLTSDELSGDSGPGGGHFGAMMLRRSDTNGDGKVDKDEFVAAAMQRFDRADANHDGQLTKAERDAALEAMRQRWQGMSGGGSDTPAPGGDQ